ncbi:hypothetical protein [Hugenholtzia roseola]|uniref:hypothetical protein n=1 Tax=Hugenholtzia roseola TaxID=1002 RepID=UPI000403ABDE|nr:hypothetical protein [Hugenholtzia roseola]
MTLIKEKKKIIAISQTLRSFLKKYNREISLPIGYEDLTRYTNAIPLYNQKGEDTLWVTVFYSPSDMTLLYEGLKKIYAILKSDGDLSVMQHLYVDRIDLCTYGNTQPFRVRIVNNINDNFDYFYIKKADASRVYGLEWEDLLSPNRISYVVDNQTLIEEHIIGVPAHEFMRYQLDQIRRFDEIRLAKEFVKFNERCFVRLLGDMHANNFVVVITPDFEESHFRLRAIDFDQQSYEGKRSVYMPKYFKENNPIIEIGLRTMTPETTRQYQREERAMIAQRIKASYGSVQDLLRVMNLDSLSTPEKVQTLREELAAYYQKPIFLKCQNMAQLLKESLRLLF